jgi:predicted chitinase
MNITPELLKKIVPKLAEKKPNKLPCWCLHLNDYIEKYEVKNIDWFLATCIFESNQFTQLIEPGDKATWIHKYFKNNSWTRHILGNFSEIFAWKYPGMGLIHCTGLFNYLLLSNFYGEDYLNYPKKLMEIEHAVKSAIWYWIYYECDTAVSFKEASRNVQGSYKHYEPRLKVLESVQDALNN